MGYIVYFSACQFFLQRHAAQSCARKKTMMQIDVLATSSHAIIKKGLFSSLYGGIPPHSLHHHRRGPLHLSSLVTPHHRKGGKPSGFHPLGHGSISYVPC